MRDAHYDGPSTPAKIIGISAVPLLAWAAMLVSDINVALVTDNSFGFFSGFTPNEFWTAVLAVIVSLAAGAAGSFLVDADEPGLLGHFRGIWLFMALILGCLAVLFAFAHIGLLVMTGEFGLLVPSICAILGIGIPFAVDQLGVL